MCDDHHHNSNNNNNNNDDNDDEIRNWDSSSSSTKNGKNVTINIFLSTIYTYMWARAKRTGEEISHTHYEYKLWFLSFADVPCHISLPLLDFLFFFFTTYRMAKAISSKTLNRNSLSCSLSLSVTLWSEHGVDMYAWFFRY